MVVYMQIYRCTHLQIPCQLTNQLFLRDIFSSKGRTAEYGVRLCAGLAGQEQPMLFNNKVILASYAVCLSAVGTGRLEFACCGCQDYLHAL
jgi:hypothetical protein